MEHLPRRSATPYSVITASTKWLVWSMCEQKGTMLLMAPPLVVEPQVKMLK